MKLYKTTGVVDISEDGSKHETRVSWQVSADAASKQRTALKAAGAHKPASEVFDIPTDKAGLLGWLNENVKA